MEADTRKLGILVVLAGPVVLAARSADAVAASAGQRMETALQQMVAAAGSPLEVSRSRVTGFASFVRTRPGHAVPVDVAATTAEARALSFLKNYGPVFGLADAGELSIVAVSSADSVGMQHVRLQQRYGGIPVTGAELVVHLRGAAVVAASARVAPIEPAAASAADVVGAGFDTVPKLSPAQAQDAVRGLLRQSFQIENATLTAPRLEILNRGLFESWRSPSVLAWFVDARTADRQELVWVDARRGGILLHFDQMPHGRNRSVYTANNGATLPGTLVRVEGGADSGDTDADLAYQFAGDSYDYYWTQLGRDSFDDAGAELRSSVHYCEATCPYANAGWNGNQMVYGEGFASADDVVAHELTHAVTERSAGLFYYMQSGALNESFSDIFGESVDLTNGHGNDDASVRWLMGEDLTTIGAIRNMMDPTVFGDPGRVGDAGYFYCGRTDSGGVHWNSGVLNHSYALVVDGGNYNGHLVTGIGLSKAGKIYYRALNYYLVSGSDFLDTFNALNQSCSDLVGSSGITAGDCTQLTAALAAVELSAAWPCTPAQPTVPALCGAGQLMQPVWTDDLENPTSGNWSLTILNNGLNHWGGGSGDGTLYYSGFATSGQNLFFGQDKGTRGSSAVGMNSSVLLPAAARLQFNHAYDIETNNNGGVVEYSTDGGGTWNDAGALITAGAPYNGVLTPSNPLKGRSAFTNLSYGYTASQLDLSSLAGQSVRFRFHMATNASLGYYGWFIDDVRIYTCSATANTLSVSKTGTGGGTVVSEPAGIACGVDCTENYGLNAVVNLTAAPDPGASFTGWSGACTGAVPACQVTMDAAKVVTATFDVPASWETLTVTKTGTGVGTVVSAPPGIDCGSQCSASFGTGSTVTLTAIADVPGYSTFDGWGGAGCSGTGTCVVTMDAAREVTASFTALPVETLTVTKTGTGSGTVTSSPLGINCGALCSANFLVGATVTLTAVSDIGFAFDGWSGEGCSGTGTCVVIMDAARTVTASFSPSPTNLVVTPAGNGSGTAASTPAGIDCGTTCSATFPAGTPITLTATASAGSKFAGWAGACTGTANACTPPTGGDRWVMAIFVTGNVLYDNGPRFNCAGCGSGGANASLLEGAMTTFGVHHGVSLGYRTADDFPVPDGERWAVESLELFTYMTNAPVGTSPITSVNLRIWNGNPGSGGTVVFGDTTTNRLSNSAFSNIYRAASTSPTNTARAIWTDTASASTTLGSGTYWLDWQTGGSASYSGPWVPPIVVTGQGATGNALVYSGSWVAVSDAGAGAQGLPFLVMGTRSYRLTVIKDGGGSGDVTSSPVAIDCGATCSEFFAENATVTLTAVASGGSTFAGWSGAGCTGMGTCLVTMDAVKSVTATFLPPCAYSVNPASANVGASGGTGSVTVTTQSWCSWTAASDNPSWLTVTTGATGIGNGSFDYSVAVNDAGARPGTITVADQALPVLHSTFTVNQAAAPCHYSITPETADLGLPGGSGTVAVTVEAWCAWTATSNDLPWLTVTSGSPGNGNGSVGYSVAALSAGARAGTITIGDRTFTVSQPFLTDRELAHGADAWQSLAALGGVAQVDYYRLAQRPYSSYEVAVDGDSGDVQPVELDRLASDVSTLLAPASQAIGTGAARSLRWRNSSSSTVTTQAIRVRSGGSCSTDCGADDTYRIRCYETTAAIPRFNNSGSQRTVLVLQNPAGYTITGTAYFWSGAGELLASSDFSLTGKQTLVLSTASLAALAGSSGTITIAHDGRYGDLSGKAVALEPATGYSFDSPMAWRSVR